MNQYIMAGDYTPETETSPALISREFHGQGYVYKNEKAYRKSLTEVCYIPETSDTTYTREDFLSLTDGNEELALQLFLRCDWQHPETLAEEDLMYDETTYCIECGKLFACYDDPKCPYCGTVYDCANHLPE